MNSILCWNHVFHQENTLMHVLTPPAKNIPKQNLRNGTLLWLRRTHSPTHLSGNPSSSDGAENRRKLHSKTNRTATHAHKALEILIPVTRPQRIKCQEPATTKQRPACVPSPRPGGSRTHCPGLPSITAVKAPLGRPAAGLKNSIYSTYIPQR